MMNNKIMAQALKVSGHYIDMNANTLTVTKAFYKKAEEYGSDECMKLLEIEKMFPTMKVEVYAPKRKSSPIPYDMMELFIRIMPDAEKNYTEYKRVKKMSNAYKSPYKFVSDWFTKTFPYHSELTAKNDKGEQVWDAVKMYAKAKEEAEKRAAAAQKSEESELPPILADLYAQKKSA